MVNAWELAKLARQAAEMGHYVIVVSFVSNTNGFCSSPRKAGDLNSIPPTLPMTVIREHAGLSDSWLDTHPNGSVSSSASTPLDAIVKHGITADSPLNTYSAGKPLDAYASRFLGKRLDYILYRQPYRPNQECPVLRASECKVVMTGKVPGYGFSFSDHFGLEATLEIDAPVEEPTSDWRTPASPHSPSTPPPFELSSASTATVIQALTACYRYSRRRARRELAIFGLCILLLFVITIGTPWLPHTWIFFLLTIFVAWLATTMLYEGFLYGSWECNALMNVIEDLEVYRRGLQIQSERFSRNSAG